MEDGVAPALRIVRPWPMPAWLAPTSVPAAAFSIIYFPIWEVKLGHWGAPRSARRMWTARPRRASRHEKPVNYFAALGPGREFLNVGVA
jgi:hypothetical protein